MSLKQRLYRLSVIRFVVVGVAIAMIGAIAFFGAPIAYADTIIRPSSQRSESTATGQNLAQVPSLEATVYRDPSCSCCEAWMEHLRENGFQVSEIQQPDMDAVKQEHNVPDDLASCHTAIINGAVIEGHVPAADIKRFLAEESDALGLAVPGMPIGSPGMESGETQEPFTVFSFDQQGSADVFNQYSS